MNCLQHYPDTSLTDDERATAARILARPATAICVTYGRILTAWSKAGARDKPVWQAKAQMHIQVCGCRMHITPDESWIFEGAEVGNE